MNGYESGAEAYVQKPFDPIILELQVKNIISLQNAMRSEIAESDSADIESSSLSVLDKEFIAKMKKIVEENISNNDFSVGDITSGLGISRSLLHIKMKNIDRRLHQKETPRHGVQAVERRIQCLRNGLP